jgi:hypothetical protein
VVLQLVSHILQLAVLQETDCGFVNIIPVVLMGNFEGNFVTSFPKILKAVL